MSKRLFFKVFLTISFLTSCCYLNLNSDTDLKAYAADYQEVKSANQTCSLSKLMFNDGYTKFADCPRNDGSYVRMKFNDGKIICRFTHLMQPSRIENRKDKLFAVLIDSKQGPVDFQFLDVVEDYSTPSTSNFTAFRCVLTPPYNSDVLAIHIYGQNEGEPDFLLHEENFLCKTKFLPANENIFYDKYFPHVVTKYDESGNVEDQDFVIRPSIWKKFTPNTYSCGDVTLGGIRFFGVLEFPKGEGKEMSYEDRAVPICLFQTNARDAEGLKEDEKHVMPSTRWEKDFDGIEYKQEEYYFNFKLPEDVTEFNLKIYYLDGYGECHQGDNSFAEYYNVKLKKED